VTDQLRHLECSRNLCFKQKPWRRDRQYGQRREIRSDGQTAGRPSLVVTIRLQTSDRLVPGIPLRLHRVGVVLRRPSLRYLTWQLICEGEHSRQLSLGGAARCRSFSRLLSPLRPSSRCLSRVPCAGYPERPPPRLADDAKQVAARTIRKQSGWRASSLSMSGVRVDKLEITHARATRGAQERYSWHSFVEIVFANRPRAVATGGGNSVYRREALADVVDRRTGRRPVLSRLCRGQCGRNVLVWAVDNAATPSPVPALIRAWALLNRLCR